MATHYSILAWRIPKDRGAWQVTIHRVTKNQTQLSMHTEHVTFKLTLKPHLLQKIGLLKLSWAL